MSMYGYDVITTRKLIVGKPVAFARRHTDSIMTSSVQNSRGKPIDFNYNV